MLIVEDDAKTAATIERYLNRAGFSTVIAHDGATGDRLAASEHADLVILDLMLPSLDGMEVCRKIRARGNTPVIMLTARADEEQRISGLLHGADDYMIKPFSPRELVARVHTVLRRAVRSVRTPATTRFANLRIDPHRRSIAVSGQLIDLTPTEYDLLIALCSSPGVPWARGTLIERVLGWDYEGTNRTIDTHMTNLRKKLHAAGLSQEARIETVFGVGYKFVCNDA